MNKLLLLFFTIFSCISHAEEAIDLNDFHQDFVIEKKRVIIPNYPHAFNAGIVRWKGQLLMSFRIIPNAKTPFQSEIGLIWLDDDFNPISEPQILDTRGPNLYPSRAEDARLLTVGDSLYMVYSNNVDETITKGGFRVFIGELVEKNGQFSFTHHQGLYDYEGASPSIREKNWTPFDFNHELLLIYSVSPHVIFRPIIDSPICETLYKSEKATPFDWGILRGGTPALDIGDEYLTVFHSMKVMKSKQGGSKEIPHYYMGAYTFSKEPPFEITGISPEPFFCEGMYEGQTYDRYWGTVLCVFPCGLLYDENYFWITYGRQDHEIWVLKVDRKKLLATLKE